MSSGMNVGPQFLGNGSGSTIASKVLLVHYHKRKQRTRWKYYGVCHPHSKLFCLLCIKVCSLTESSTRCSLLEKISETIYQVYKVILRKQDININRITFLGKRAPYSWYFKRTFVYYLSHCCNVFRYFYNKINVKNL